MAVTSLQQLNNLFGYSPDPTPDYSNYNQSDFDNSWQYADSGAVNDSTPLNNPALSYSANDVSTATTPTTAGEAWYPVASPVTTPVSNQKMSIYNNAAGNLVSQADYEKAMTERYANTVINAAGDKGYTGTGTQSRAGINAPQPNTGGGISFSFGGGGGGGGSSVPSNVLTPRQFPPYTSTYTPPTPATPDPYNWATRDPYIYGEGLSNAGAAYDIWGSAPGTNPYLLSTPSSYTPGLLGMQPVQLPSNVPSTNVGANINPGGTGGTSGTGGTANDGWAGGDVMGHTAYATADDAMAAGDYWSSYRKDHQQWRDSQGIYAGGGKQPGQSDLHYPGNPALGIRSDAQQLQAMGMGGENTGNLSTTPTNTLSYEEQLNILNKEKFEQLSTEGTLGSTGPQTVHGTDFSPDRWDDYTTTAPVVTKVDYTAKKEKAKASVAAYNATPTGKKYSIDLTPKAGTYGGRPRL